jgi:DNA or RNA helicases of superfamily II
MEESTERLCAQVISCVQQMWGCREYIHSLRIYRFFGGRDIPDGELCGGVVVSSIQQLHSRIKSNDEELNNIITNTGAMIIDEAHRAVSSMYDRLLEKTIELNAEGFPICGLSATPGRTGLNKHDEIVKLVGRFQTYLIEPDLGDAYKDDPLRYFRKNEFLANVKHITYRSGREFTLTEQEMRQISVDFDEYLGPTFLKRLSRDNERNLTIIKKLLDIPKGKPTLIYACTVEHAHFLSVILTANGRPAGTISSDTPLTIRRGLILDFKVGKIDFICNYGVLTTGFDAPKTEYVVICRPMTSVILYEQIIGRGVRGSKFGGTDQCTVIDFADNIHRLGPSLAYARFSDYWSSEEFQ